MRTLICAISLIAACGVEPRAGRALRVQVNDEDGRPLAEIPVEIDGLLATKTSDAGRASISLARSGPGQAQVAVRCGEDHRELAARRVLREPMDTPEAAPLELSFVCRPRLRTLALVVRAQGAEGLMVRADGEPLGRVEADGTFHGSVSRAPDSELRVTIDAGEQPLVPRSALRVVQVADRDELIILDQTFERRASRSSSRARTNALAARILSEMQGCHDSEERGPARSLTR